MSWSLWIRGAHCLAKGALYIGTGIASVVTAVVLLWRVINDSQNMISMLGWTVVLIATSSVFHQQARDSYEALRYEYQFGGAKGLM